MEPNGEVANSIGVIAKITQALLKLEIRMMTIGTGVGKKNG